MNATKNLTRAIVLTLLSASGSASAEEPGTTPGTTTTSASSGVMNTLANAGTALANAVSNVGAAPAQVAATGTPINTSTAAKPLALTPPGTSGATPAGTIASPITPSAPTAPGVPAVTAALANGAQAATTAPGSLAAQPATPAVVTTTPVDAATLAAMQAGGTPLTMRESKPLALASDPNQTTWPYKLLLGAVVLGAGAFAWQKKKNQRGAEPAKNIIRISGRATLGMRAEVALVEVDGMRVLVGLTSSAIQTLAVLPDHDPAEADSGVEATTTESPQLVDRVRTLFGDGVRGETREARSEPAPRMVSRYAQISDEDARLAPPPATTPRRRVRETPLEGQARGLAFALGNRK